MTYNAGCLEWQGQSLIVGRYITPIYLSYPPFQFQSLCHYFSHRSLVLPSGQMQMDFSNWTRTALFLVSHSREQLSLPGYYHRFQGNIDCIPTVAMLKVSRYAQPKNWSSTIGSPCCSFPNLTLIYKDDTGTPFVSWFFTLFPTKPLMYPTS